MPFITEELWQNTAERAEGESIMICRQPGLAAADESQIAAFEVVKQIVSAIRSIRLEKNIPAREKLSFQILGQHDATLNSVLVKMAGLESIENSDEKAAGAVSFMVGTTEYAVLLGSLINVDEEVAKMQTEIDYLQGFLKSVMGKLSNERFVANAKPEVVEAERKKKADAESKIKSLEDSIASLRK